MLRLRLKSNESKEYFMWTPQYIHDPWPWLVFTIFTDCVLCAVRGKAQETVLQLGQTVLSAHAQLELWMKKDVSIGHREWDVYCNALRWQCLEYDRL
jgi:hypothetical protein